MFLDEEKLNFFLFLIINSSLVFGFLPTRLGVNLYEKVPKLDNFKLDFFDEDIILWINLSSIFELSKRVKVVESEIFLAISRFVKLM